MTGAYAWTLVGIGVALLGLTLAIATLTWSRWRKRRTAAEQQRREAMTQRAFDEQGPD